MRIFLTGLLLSTALFTKAQVVNIPDNVFKNYLLNYSGVIIDSNHDGDIQQSEAEAITVLSIGLTSSQRIADMTGIEAFTNLTQLTCSGHIGSLILNISNQIKKLQITSDSLRTLDLSGCINVEELGVLQSKLPALDISNCKKIKDFGCWSAPNLHSLTFGVLDSLNHISIFTTSLDSLDVSTCKNLENVNIEGNAFKRLNFSGLNKLHHFDVESENQLRYVDITGCGNLSYFSIAFCSVSSLDFSSCPILSNLRVYSSLEYLNLKNGSSLQTLVISNPNTGGTLNICADEFETDLLAQTVLPINTNYSQINISPYCSFFPGGIYNTIKGTMRVDVDNNGCDGNDGVVPNVPIKITDNSGNVFIRYGAPNGGYGFYPYKGVFTLTPYLAYPYFSISPLSAVVSFDTANNLENITNFCIRPTSVHNDLEITFLPAASPAAARPGFDAGYTLVYKNRGTTTLSGSVQVNFDNSRINFVSASTAITSQSTGQLIWNYNNLRPFESRTIDVTFNLLPPPANNNGDTLTYLASVNPSANDETAFDNSFILPQLVRGSMDPNEKQCLEGSKIDISKIGDDLHYQIHFQNEGTDTAFNVVITDVLSNKLDWNSFEMISSSHPVTVSQKNGKLEFTFENIKLPYKAINEPASNGYVAFKIKPKPSVVVGDSLNNTAAIYFDFNMPVITNRATTIVTNSSTPVPVKVEYFSISSRNNINTLNWKAACSNGTAKFSIERSDDGIHFSSIGLITATSVRCQLPFNFSDNDPVAGKNYYRLKITDVDGVSFYSNILVARNNKSGLEITAVANNILHFKSNKQQTIQMKVIAADGKEILNNKQIITAGSNRISLQLKNVAGQICTVIVYTNDGEVITKRFIK